MSSSTEICCSVQFTRRRVFGMTDYYKLRLSPLLLCKFVMRHLLYGRRNLLIMIIFSPDISFDFNHEVAKIKEA